MTLLTFIIPVRHPENAKNWGLLKAKLVQTIASIAAQSHPDWRAIIVANHGADIPPLPESFSVTRVNFPPNNMHDRGNASEADFLDAFRIDKGRRVLAGMLEARDSRFFMIVDDDDFVSARLAEFVAGHDQENGWVINDGYVWDDGGSLLFATDAFNNVCGTSLIIRSDLYGLPASLEAADPEWIKTMLGSHKRVLLALEQQKTPLRPLPFKGAIYRVGQSGSHSGVGSFLRTYFFSRRTMVRPWLFFGNLLKLRFISKEITDEFFGAPS